jgi:hypothetical protein
MTYPAAVPARPNKSVNYMIPLGKWVAAQAALGHMSFDGVAKTYKGTGVVWPTNVQQISKLRTFWHFGRTYGADAVLWLEEWQEHRTGTLSIYETLLAEMRARL